MNTFSKKMILISFEIIVVICVLCLLVALLIGYKYFEYKNLLIDCNKMIEELEIKVNTQNYEYDKIVKEINEVKEYINELHKEDDVVEEEPETTVDEHEPAFFLSDYQRHVTECIVAGESMGEPYEGQVAVAECIINACLKDGLQPSEVRTKYKYSGWHNEPSESVKKAVSAVFDDGYRIADKPIMYFYAFKYTKSNWHESQDFVMEIGGHRFFAEWDN